MRDDAEGISGLSQQTVAGARVAPADIGNYLCVVDTFMISA